MRARSARRRGTFVILVALFAIVTAAVMLVPAQEAIQRSLNPTLDVSASTRLFAVSEGFHAFLSSPLIGLGAHDSYTISPEGWALAGHSSFVVMAYEFGLTLIVPFAWLLLRLAGGYLALYRGAATPIERGLAEGMIASLAAAIVTGFFNPVFGDVMQDAVIWTFAGLAVVWNSWKRRDPLAVLLT
jgi:hypothetical protein